MLCGTVDSWLGMFCEYNLISHASAFSLWPHVVTLFAHSKYFHFSTICQFKKNKPDYNTRLFYMVPNMVFRFKCYNLPFSGGGIHGNVDKY